jgi:hypothetical protein
MHRLNVFPIFHSHWKILSPTWRDSPPDIFWFVILPAGLAYWGLKSEINHQTALDFVLKFAILLVPLMLNLLFTLYRCMQDEEKRHREEMISAKGDRSLSPQDLEVDKQNAKDKANTQKKAFEELCVHVIYVSLSCLVLALVCGIGLMFLPKPDTNGVFTLTQFELSLIFLAYLGAFHAFLTVCFVLQKSYKVMHFSISRAVLS